MPAGKAQPENVVHQVFRYIRSELASAEGHFQAHEDIFQAHEEGRPELTPFHDFFELTMSGHFAGMILSVARILDRDPRAASIPWLLGQIENEPGRFRTEASTLEDIRKRLARADSLVHIRRIRNKKIAHSERMTVAQSRSFWDTVALTEGDMKELLALLVGVMNDVERILWRRAHYGSGKMYAVEHETGDVLKALRFALANGCPIEGIDPSYLERLRREAAESGISDFRK
jgi:hypothetical protein